MKECTEREGERGLREREREGDREREGKREEVMNVHLSQAVK